MSKHVPNDPYKEKFRSDADEALDREIEEALGGLSIDALLDADRPELVKPASDRPAPPHRPGDKQTRRGKIVRIDRDDVFVDFGGKSQGVVSLQQFEGEEPKAGDEMDFNVERYDEREGLLVLSRKGATAQGVTWENLEIGTLIEATVTGVNKGGLELEFKNMRGFMPAGQVELFHVPDFKDYIGKKLTAEVTQFEAAQKNLILSRRNILEREKEEAKTKLMAELVEGQIRRGTVRNVMDFGAFVDLGGVDGLLHVSEITFKRGRHNAGDFVKVGDVVDVKILKIDKETGKLSLSLKQARGVDPWADASVKYAVGTTITGRVTRVEAFGAFIEVEEGVEGLLPVSEMSYQRIRHPSDMAKEGDTLKLVVLSIDPTAKRLSFSLKQAGPDPWATAHERYAVETNVNGTVTRVVDFGAFVELEPGLEGLVHISQMGVGHVRKAGDMVKPGQNIRVHILEIDKQARRISLSIQRVAETELPAPPAGSVPATPEKKKKRPQLRGGLDF